MKSILNLNLESENSGIYRCIITDGKSIFQSNIYFILNLIQLFKFGFYSHLLRNFSPHKLKVSSVTSKMNKITFVSFLLFLFNNAASAQKLIDTGKVWNISECFISWSLCNQYLGIQRKRYLT